MIVFKLVLNDCLFPESPRKTNIQKPPVYQQLLPRVLETKTNNKYNPNLCSKNIATKFLPRSSTQCKTPTTQPNILLSSDNVTREQRQSRVDRILEKYRRQPSNSSSRQFSRSFSCNTATDSATLSTESNSLCETKAMVVGSRGAEIKSNLGPQSVSPYALFDRSDSTHINRQELKTKNSCLPKSYSLKSLGEYPVQASVSVPSTDSRPVTKLNDLTSSVNNDEDPPSSASSSSSTTTSTTSKSMAAPKEDPNQNSCSSALLDWTLGNHNEETVSDRIRRRSFYVKLK